MTDFCSSRRNVCGTFASYSSLGDERYLPREGLSIPFPHARMNPTNIDATPLAQSERERSSATYGGFTSNRLIAPRKCTPCLPLQCGGTRRDARIRCASPMHALDQHAFRAAVMNQIAPRTAYPVDLAVSRETCSALRWYSVSTVKTPLYRLLRRPHAPMRRQMHSQSK